MVKGRNLFFFRMGTIILLMIFAFPGELKSAPQNLSAEEYFNRTLLSLYQFDFQKADSLSSLMNAHHPGHYLSAFSRTHYYWWMLISHAEPKPWEEKYAGSVAHSIAAIDPVIERSFTYNDVFYFINIYAMQARLSLKNGKLIRTMQSLRNCIYHLELSFGREHIHSGFYLTSGLYNYMTAHAVKKYPFLRLYALFYPEGDQSLGLEQIIMAAQSENDVWKTEARYLLMRLYLEVEENPGKALEYALWLTEEYPLNLIYRYYHLLILKNLDKEDQVVLIKEELGAMARANRNISSEQRDYFLELKKQ